MDNYYYIVKKKETYEMIELDRSKIYSALEKALTVDELIPILEALAGVDEDVEFQHCIADSIVIKALQLLGQYKLAEKYDAVPKWYS